MQYTYTMHDRMIIMGVNPVSKSLELLALESLTKAEYFLERRELGIINVGGKGSVSVNSTTYELDNKDSLYIGRGTKAVSFKSEDSSIPAEFYINSLPAQKEYPTVKETKSDSNEVALGSKENCNEGVIFQFIHEDGIKSCQLVMGFTELKPGSIWNTFPPHTHYRIMEAYLSFDLPKDQMVMHFMGVPSETRHLAIKNKQAVISPEWSIHPGAGTSAYSFIWGMGGENQSFNDMDSISLSEIR